MDTYTQKVVNLNLQVGDLILSSSGAVGYFIKIDPITVKWYGRDKDAPDITAHKEKDILMYCDVGTAVYFSVNGDKLDSNGFHKKETLNK